jgi:hypothetical protein
MSKQRQMVWVKPLGGGSGYHQYIDIDLPDPPPPARAQEPLRPIRIETPRIEPSRHNDAVPAIVGGAIAIVGAVAVGSIAIHGFAALPRLFKIVVFLGLLWWGYGIYQDSKTPPMPFSPPEANLEPFSPPEANVPEPTPTPEVRRAKLVRLHR